jgi:hypothetical protein
MVPGARKRGIYCSSCLGDSQQADQLRRWLGLIAELSILEVIARCMDLLKDTLHSLFVLMEVVRDR